MKNEFHGGRKHRGVFTEKSLLALALAFCLMMAPFLSSAAEQFETGKCSLTVWGTDTEELPEDWSKAGVVVDLYQVADTADGYSYTLLTPFDGQLAIENDMNADQWRAQAQKAIETVLKTKADPAKTGINIGTRVTDLDAGLYLLIARGKELVTDTNEDGEIVTKARSDGYTYTFLPELVALPDRAPEGTWIRDLEVYLKMEWKKNDQRGAIQIVKTLEGYNENNGPATFVFDVEAVLDGRTVYSNVVTIVFDGSGEKKLLVEGIPVGAKVTVTEVYSGACYSLVTDKTKTVTIRTDKDILSVSFKNQYDDRPNDGHGITNHFRRGENGWKLDQKYDKTQG